MPDDEPRDEPGEEPADEAAEAPPGSGDEGDDVPECRICRDTDGEMIVPCGCRGTQKYVHSHCLWEWLQHSHSTTAGIWATSLGNVREKLG